MTEGLKIKPVLEAGKTLSDIDKWNTVIKKETRPDKRKKAVKERDEFVLKIAKEEGADVDSVEDIPEKEREGIYSLATNNAISVGARRLYDQRKTIVRDEIPTGALEEMVSEHPKEFFTRIPSPEDRRVLEPFAQYITLKSLAESYKKGEDVATDKETRAYIDEARARGAVKSRKKEFEKYDESTRELAESIIHRLAAQGLVDKKKEREYVSEGLAIMVKEAKEEAKKAGDAYKPIREILLNMIGSDEPDDFNAANSMITKYVKLKEVEKYYTRKAA